MAMMTFLNTSELYNETNGSGLLLFFPAANLVKTFQKKRIVITHSRVIVRKEIQPAIFPGLPVQPPPLRKPVRLQG